MALLTFSQFAILLYPYCGDGANKSEFVKTLTNRIMKGQPARAKGEGHINPMLSKEMRSLQNYFNGTRPIPRQDANKILGRIDKYRFEDYLRGFSDDALSGIEIALSKLIGKDTSSVNVNSTDIVARCADIYEEILLELAKRGLNENNKK